MSVEVILSPDLALEEKRQDARAVRLLAARRFQIGQTVKAGSDGKPGTLETLTPEGFAAIRWDDGSLLCGVEADRLTRVEPLTVKLRNGLEVVAKRYKGELCAVTYANRTQAEKACRKLGPGWAVYHFGRPFYVGRSL